MWVGDYDPGAPVALLAELVVPPWPAGIYRVAQSMLVWADPADGVSRRDLRQDVVIQIARMLTARLDDHVMNIVEKVGAFKMGTRALEVAQNVARQAIAGESTDPNERGAATLRLRQAATRLLDMGEPVLASAMLQQADSLELNGSLDPEATKKLRYETRRITQHE
jgi:Ca-activated chloride channel family protein